MGEHVGLVRATIASPDRSLHALTVHPRGELRQGRAEPAGDGGPRALVGVADDELDAARAPPSEPADELGPEGLGLRGADVEAEDVAAPVAVDADRDDDGDRDDAVAPRGPSTVPARVGRSRSRWPSRCALRAALFSP